MEHDKNTLNMQMLVSEVSEPKKVKPPKSLKLGIKRFFFGFSFLALVGTTLAVHDMSEIYKEEQKQFVFSNNFQYSSDLDDYFAHNPIVSYERNLYLFNKNPSNPLNLLILAGKLQLVNAHINNQNSNNLNNDNAVYSYLNPNNEYSKKVQNMYFSSPEYLQDKELKRQYFKDLLLSVDKAKEHQFYEDFNITPISKALLRQYNERINAHIIEKIQRSLYASYYGIEYQKEILTILKDSEFDIISLASVPLEDLDKYWQKKYSKKFGGDKFPEYLKGYLLKEKMPLNEIIKFLDDLKSKN